MALALARRRRLKPKDDSHAWALGLMEDGETRRTPHESVWWENISTYAGDLWTEFDVHTRQLRENRPADYKVRIPINLAQPVIRTEYAKLLKNRPIMDVLAKSGDTRDLNAAKVGDKMMNHYAEKEFHLGKVRRRAVWWMLICGWGGIFVDHDPSLLGEQEVMIGPDGDPVFDERAIAAAQQYWKDRRKKPKTQRIAHGDLVITPVSPFQMLWDLSKTYLEDAAWCIHQEVFDVDEVYRRWGKDVEPEEDALPGVIQRRLLAKADLTGKMTMRNVETQKMVKVNRLFVKPGHRYFADGAEIVFTETEVLDSSEAYPFEHGQLPVSGMGHIPFGVSQYPMSVLTQIRGPVLEVSRTASQLVENRNLMANPPWIQYEQNRIKGDIENRPGARLTVQYMPNVPEPHPVQMPEMPAYVQNLMDNFKSNILEISGQGETSQGKVPAGARSGVSIAYLQEEDDTKLGPTVMEFEEMIERSHAQILNGFAQFYDAPRTIRINHKNADPEVFDFIGSQLAGVAGLEVQAGSALPRSKAAKQQYILDLFDRGIETDPVRIKEMLELGEGEPEEVEVDKNQAERENRMLDNPEGEQPDVLEWYNHAIHHQVHRRHMKTQEFQEQSREIQAAYQQHDDEHSRIERQQAQQQMVNQAPLGGGGGGGGAPPQPQLPAGPPGSQPPNLANGTNNQQALGSTTDLGAGSAIEAPPQ